MNINRKTEKDDLDIKNDLFIIPIEYEDELNKSPKSDMYLHFSKTEGEMYNKGSKIWCHELPENFSFAKEIRNSPIHYQTIANPSGERYMPLFNSYNIMTSIYGKNLKVGIISYETAKEFCLKEGFKGIVVAPGNLNKIIPKEEL